MRASLVRNSIHLCSSGSPSRDFVLGPSRGTVCSGGGKGVDFRGASGMGRAT